uniref:Predicted protein n=1 Tax=Physcomitrium patens TaxID=3218 RepID=A9U7B0_PHYPA
MDRRRAQGAGPGGPFLRSDGPGARLCRTACRPRQHAGRCAPEAVLVPVRLAGRPRPLPGPFRPPAPAHAPHAVFHRHPGTRPMGGLHGPGHGRDRRARGFARAPQGQLHEHGRLDAEPVAGGCPRRC